MAKITLTIPDGEYCSDNHHLDCLQASHKDGIHMCTAFGRRLGPLLDVSVNNETRRVRRKCVECLDNMKADNGDGLRVDTCS